MPISQGRVVLLSGIPSVGKTNFLRYAKDHGTVTVSLARENADDLDLDHFGVHAEWNAFIEHGNPRFVEWAKAISDKTILEWGFPPNCLPIVKKVHAGGIPAWWMDGDEAIARQKHEEAGKPLPCFDAQIKKIRENKESLLAFYGNRVILRLRSDGSFLDNETVL
jgi:hypothetical protein